MSNTEQQSNVLTFSGLGTNWWIEIFDDIDAHTGAVAKGNCARMLSDFESAYSRFIPTSHLSILNNTRTLLQPTPEFIALLSYGQKLFLQSNGHFNILVGHILEARGYDSTYSFTPTDVSEKPCSPLLDLQITSEAITLSCGNVDIGGFGKGYVIDKLASTLKESGVMCFIINGGGDMFATSNNGRSIPIYLEHPLEPGICILETSLLNQGFAASSPFKRSWTVNSQTYSHIVNIQNNEQASASFVKAAAAADADAFATTALLIPESTLERLAKIESFSVARFYPDTNQLWCTKTF